MSDIRIKGDAAEIVNFQEYLLKSQSHLSTSIYVQKDCRVMSVLHDRSWIKSTSVMSPERPTYYSHTTVGGVKSKNTISNCHNSTNFPFKKSCVASLTLYEAPERGDAGPVGV